MASCFQIIVLVLIVTGSSSNNEIPSIKLHNAADPNLRMPVVGHGQCCGRNVTDWFGVGFNSSLQWYSIGGRRYDSAYNYATKWGVAAALLNITQNWTKISRSEFFVTSKIGGTEYPHVTDGTTLGYNDTLTEWRELITLFNTTYIDLLLIHWPSPSQQEVANMSTDPFCNTVDINYNASLCRQSTWKALEYIFNNGGAKAIGVSNFEEKHLNDIFALNSLKPAINQFEFHGYWHEYNLIEFCQNNQITVNSYCPLGAPDYTNWTTILPKHPTAIQIGSKYSKSASQIWLKWALQQNIVVNPRSYNISHMQQNLDLFDFELTQDDMLNLASVTPPPNDKICPNPSNLP